MEDFEIIDYSSLNERVHAYTHSQTINQIHRKIKLIKEFRSYVYYSDTNTTYYKHIINAKIYEGYIDQNDERVENIYKLLPGLFGKLYEYRVSESPDHFYKTLLEL